MNLDQTIAHCARLGVRLALTDDGKLRVNAPSGVLDDALRATLGRHKDAITETLLRQRALAAPTRADKAERYPLSHAQRRLWILDRIEPGSSAYLIPSAMPLPSDIDVETLFAAIRAIARRHESLRTTFCQVDGVPYQVVHDQPLLDLACTTLPNSAAPTESPESVLTEALAAQMQSGFDLERGPLFRARVIDVGAGQRVLFLAMHHIIGDGWSNSIFLNELHQHYAAIRAGQTAADLPPLGLQYVDYATWQSSRLDGPNLQRLLDYWRPQLQAAPMLQLPTDRPRLHHPTAPGGLLQHHFPADQTAALQRLAKQRGTTLFTVLLSAFYVLLNRLSGQHDLVIGTDVANRTRREWEPLIGFFVNQLVLRADLSGAPTFAELVTRVHGLTQDAYAHQDMPFNVLVEHLVQARDASVSPFFQVKFIMQNTPGATATDSAANITLPERTAKFDMTWSMSEDAQGLMLDLEYACNLFDRTTFERWLGHYSELLAQVIAAPDASIRTYLLDPAGQQVQIERARRVTQFPAESETIGRYVEHWAAHSPAAIAVQSGSASISYGALNEAANRLARHLRDWGVDLETPVGVCMDASIDYVVAVTAISKAGGVLVAMDPAYPEQRLAQILDAAAMQVLLCQSQHLDRLPAYQLNFLGVIKTDTDASEWSTQSAENLCLPTHPDQLAYLIFTSGTTGKPKGVMVAASGIGNLARAQAKTFSVDATSRVLQFASISFDASIWELLMALAQGATLVAEPRPTLMPGADLARALAQHRITHVTLPPTALSVMSPTAGASLAALVLAGEACHDEHVRPWARITKSYNAYGPSETTVCASVESYAIDRGGFAGSIGHAIDGCGLYVVDASGNLALPLAAGELWITGPAVGRGYWNDPAQTALRFVPDPFSDIAGARAYRSGDSARTQRDHRVEFLGRLDNQVKIRGHRIELSEIERALLGQTGISAAVVIANGNPAELHAYVVTTSGLLADEPSLKKSLRLAVPEYMIPRTVTTVPRIPTTANGKLDMAALPTPHRERSHDAGMADRSPQQALIAGIWCEVLDIDAVGIDDNFFDVGGHSLLLIQVQDRMQQRCGLALSVADLFKYPTVRDLANLLAPDPALEAAPLSDDRIARRQMASRDRAERRQARPVGAPT
ncbi:hypothetical protein C7S18_07990 [Ahniella affigens]|uniref:Carrier domain-containing protein n=1 Tax=Ahniella affigens TaxID=2021234 RepID=A0A2P1PQK8_9GAMM|nr:non-ribosomal peptide synthetase [Ahniella affigens]AVP97136.1 hypothetical protein C7S18_07990 [Ahniella affigens]